MKGYLKGTLLVGGSLAAGYLIAKLFEDKKEDIEKKVEEVKEAVKINQESKDKAIKAGLIIGGIILAGGFITLKDEIKDEIKNDIVNKMDMNEIEKEVKNEVVTKLKNSAMKELKKEVIEYIDDFDERLTNLEDVDAKKWNAISKGITGVVGLGGLATNKLSKDDVMEIIEEMWGVCYEG